MIFDFLLLKFYRVNILNLVFSLSWYGPLAYMIGHEMTKIISNQKISFITKLHVTENAIHFKIYKIDLNN